MSSRPFIQVHQRGANGQYRSAETVPQKNWVSGDAPAMDQPHIEQGRPHYGSNQPAPKQHAQSIPKSVPAQQNGRTAYTPTQQASSVAQQRGAAAASTGKPVGYLKPSGKPLRKSNSTGSLFVTTTITSPFTDELIFSVSTMLHCQMVRDEGATARKKSIFPFFHEDKYTGKLERDIPEPDSIYKWLKQIFDVGEFPSECVVILLLYVNRLVGLVGMPLTPQNWRPITITALITAQKVWDDTPLANADFSILYPVLNIRQINYLELNFLVLLQYRLNISPSLYARYYFELRTISDSEAQKPTMIRRRRAARLGLREKKPKTRKAWEFEDCFPYDPLYHLHH